MMINFNQFINVLSQFSHQIKDRIVKKPAKGDEKCSTGSIQTQRKVSFNKHERTDFDSTFNYLFYHLGRLVATYPSYFILFPLFLTLVALTGFQHAVNQNDFEYLWHPRDGPAPQERSVIESYFPLNYSNEFLPYHTTRLKGYTRLFITAKDGDTVFRSNIFNDLVFLDKLIQNITIDYQGKQLSYIDVCAKWKGSCFYNDVLDLEEYMPDIEKGTMMIDFPLMTEPFVVPMYFGGMQIDEENGYILSAKAISISYFLNLDTIEYDEISLIWEKEFLEEMARLQFRHIDFVQITSTSVKEESQKNVDGLMVLLPIMVAIILVYTVISVMVNDWVRSKPYIALLGILTAALGTVTGFGLLIYLGTPTIGINGIIPFLMLGIGLDDMFVILSAWRRTPQLSSVVDRLAEAYGEAGVSITITSLTNIVSFAIGMTTPVGAVRIFCLYTSVSLIICYIWHLTFFGGCMAVAGYLEKDQRHALFCVRVLSKSEADKNGKKIYRRWMAGGINPQDPYNPIDNQSPSLAIFFEDKLGAILMTKMCKYLLLAIFLIYMGGAIYGCTQAKEGFDRENIFRYDSYAVKFITIEDNLFRKFPYTIQFTITGDLEYSNNATRERVLQLHKELEAQPFIYKGLFTQSTIRSFYRYLNRRPEIGDNIKNETDFIQALKKRYLRGNRNRRSMDFIFNENHTKITAFRFMMQSYEVNNTNQDRAMSVKLREIADNYSDLIVTSFNPNYILFDTYGGTLSGVLQATLIAAVAMIGISLIFVPKHICSLVVGFSIVSIEIGVVGYMSLWSVKLDPISSINLIMCIGFSVDFSAHVSYSYLSSKADSPKEKVKESLFCLGLPIVQGGVSTILCVCTLPFAPSYTYIAFFKVVVLVIVCAVMHGLLFIPVILALFDRTHISLTIDQNTNPQLGIRRRSSVMNVIVGQTELYPEPTKLRRVSMSNTTLTGIDELKESKHCSIITIS